MVKVYDPDDKLETGFNKMDQLQHLFKALRIPEEFSANLTAVNIIPLARGAKNVSLHTFQVGPLKI